MGLSEAMLFAFAATIICAFAIAEKIIDIDFEQFMPKNLKKAKMKRILAKRETPLQGARLQKDIKDSFENVLLPLGKADKGYLPKRMDLTFRRKMVHQVELLGKRKLCRDIQVTLYHFRKIISKDGMMTDGSGGSLSCNVVLWNVLFLLKLVRQCIRSIGKTVTFGFFSQGISAILTVRVRTRNFIPIKGRSPVHPVELRWN